MRQTSASPVGRTLLWSVVALVAIGCVEPPPFAPVRDGGVRAPRDAQSDALTPTSDGGPSDAGDGGGDGGFVEDFDGGTVVRTGPFDPGQVYLRSTIDERDCNHSVIAALDGTGDVWAGFDCGAMAHRIRADGTIVYLDTTADLGASGALRTFVPETWTPADPYPASPVANDVALATPECTRVNSFRLAPLSSEYFYSCVGCTADCLHRSSGGTYDPPGASFWRGYGGRTLVSPHSFGVEYGIVDASGASVPADVSSVGDQMTVRARADGFRLVTTQAGTGEILTHIAFDGATTRLGVFPPIDTALYFPPTSCVLDAMDRLYCSAIGRTRPDVVLRRTLGATAAEIVFDESTSAGVTDTRFLVTGD